MESDLSDTILTDNNVPSGAVTDNTEPGPAFGGTRTISVRPLVTGTALGIAT